MPETRLVAKLKATSGVTTLVSTRITPGYRKQGTALPAIVYQVYSDRPVNHAGGTTDTSEMRLSVYCMAATYAGSKALAAAVKAAISGWTDSSGSVWHLESQSDDIGDPMSGQDVPEYYAINQEYTVWY
jgi:hypothetical protein